MSTYSKDVNHMRARKPKCRRLDSEGGAALLVSVIFLVILTLLGISAATVTTLDEKMARNLRDRNIAFQAAEAALRDARADIFKTRNLSGYTGFPVIAAGGGGCNTTPYKGLCRPSTGTTQVWQDYFDDADSDKFVSYGEITGLSADKKFQLSPNPGGVTKQPRYLIEVIADPDSNESLKIGKPKVLYRITSIGYGSNDGTNVLLQEVVRP